MINSLFNRFDEKVVNYLDSGNLTSRNAISVEKGLSSIVKEFCEVEECVMNLVIASSFVSGSEVTYTVVVSVIDEINHTIVSRTSNLRFTLNK